MGAPPEDDPLALAIAPPPNETAEQREARLNAEAEARRISEKIDEQLRVDKAAHRKRRSQTVKVLLLGQSESGKSTTLKNFQITYSPNTWAEERNSWRTVIQLNLVRNINSILNMLAEEMANTATSDPAADADADASDDDDGDGEGEGEPSAAATRATSPTVPLRFTDRHALLKLRLTPLRGLQHDLEDTLGVSGTDDIEHPLQRASTRSPARRTSQEAFIRSHTSWKSKLRSVSEGNLDGMSKRYREAKTREAMEVLAGCKDDIREVWEDEMVQEMLRQRKFVTESVPGFFLNDVERIAARDYEPSDNDIVRARLRTMGVQEYGIKFQIGPAAGTEWLMYDVGGSRTQRAAWFPYFDDCDAIIFLAPISCFDERLAEDRKVNRLEDSYMLWRLVCSSKLLQNTQMILFLNKYDLLDQKLKRGVKVNDHVRSYGDRPNDAETASKYFSQHFREIMKRHSPQPRQFRVHTTSVIDTKATAVTLGIVEEGILQAHLRSVELI
ncbi:G-alpha-domain-containing protein [Rhodofomes roseus]|uniref:G-alpha-domain-containing protein n=1 Tax=Rhodofomes roseus TaxID=34475 RepID=A0ABQ8KK14_9APHY|nr:G-alpha-domain-containing protein [Rhodofomes roseus]KAH9837774.1 G-alpha-domain-containing protein [Rhodofomes roseus]